MECMYVYVCLVDVRSCDREYLPSDGCIEPASPSTFLARLGYSFILAQRGGENVQRTRLFCVWTNSTGRARLCSGLPPGSFE